MAAFLRATIQQQAAQDSQVQEEESLEYDLAMGFHLVLNLLYQEGELLGEH